MCAKLLNWRGNFNFHDWRPDHLCARADQSCVNQRPHMREQADHLCVDNRNYPQVGVTSTVAPCEARWAMTCGAQGSFP